MSAAELAELRAAAQGTALPLWLAVALRGAGLAPREYAAQVFAWLDAVAARQRPGRELAALVWYARYDRARALTTRSSAQIPPEYRAAALAFADGALRVRSELLAGEPAPKPGRPIRARRLSPAEIASLPYPPPNLVTVQGARGPVQLIRQAADAYAELERLAGIPLPIWSAWRSDAEQLVIWNRELRKRKGNVAIARKWAAPPPGAVDLNGRPVPNAVGSEHRTGRVGDFKLSPTMLNSSENAAALRLTPRYKALAQYGPQLGWVLYDPPEPWHATFVGDLA